MMANASYPPPQKLERAVALHRIQLDAATTAARSHADAAAKARQDLASSEARRVRLEEKRVIVAQQTTSLMQKVAILMSRLELTEAARRDEREREEQEAAGRGRAQIMKFTQELEELNADLQAHSAQRGTARRARVAAAAGDSDGEEGAAAASGRGASDAGSGDGEFTLRVVGRFNAAGHFTAHDDESEEGEVVEAPTMLSAADAARKAAAATAINKQLQDRIRQLEEEIAKMHEKVQAAIEASQAIAAGKNPSSVEAARAPLAPGSPSASSQAGSEVSSESLLAPNTAARGRGGLGRAQHAAMLESLEQQVAALLMEKTAAAKAAAEAAREVKALTERVRFLEHARMAEFDCEDSSPPKGASVYGTPSEVSRVNNNSAFAVIPFSASCTSGLCLCMLRDGRDVESL